MKNRLIAVHLHDNDGTEDKHWLPFAGTTDWQRLAHLIGTSGCTKTVLSLEPTTRGAEIDSQQYLQQALESGQRFAEMVASEQDTSGATA